MAWATVFGTLSIYFGLLASYHLNIAAGAAIVLTAVIIFFMVFTVQTVRGQEQGIFQTGFQIRKHLGQPLASVVMREAFDQSGAPSARENDRQKVVHEGGDLVGRRQSTGEYRFAGFSAHAQDAAS